MITENKANKIYDVLIEIGGASKNMKDDFIYRHLHEEYACTEWRFMGKLGYGGKYRSITNSVDCYLEDDTP